jgi:hypothetical protein
MSEPSDEFKRLKAAYDAANAALRATLDGPEWRCAGQRRQGRLGAGGA